MSFHHPFWLENVAPWCWATRQSIVGWMFAIANYEASAPKVWLPAGNGGFLTGRPIGWFPEIPCVLREQSHETCIFPDIKTFSVIWIIIFLSFAFLWKVASPSHTSTNIRHSKNIYLSSTSTSHNFFFTYPTPRKSALRLQTVAWLRAAVGGPKGTDSSAWSKLHKLLVPSAPRRTVNDSNLFGFWEYRWGEKAHLLLRGVVFYI